MSEQLPQKGPRGRLVVFVGAAPGAGKTFAMLVEGRRLHHLGQRVLVGLAETYGRPRTVEASVELEQVPPRLVLYQGHEFPVVDVRAILEARPDVVLIDEIYRTNPPGATHEKRWQDVEDLRDHGITVLTTMNIQHLEGMKDIAENIAGISVRETVPDQLVESADEIQLVDISPEALRKRMQHGNIYPQDRVDKALRGFFRPGNLAALRELALRWLADVDSRSMGIAERLPSEHVLVAVRPRDEAEGVVRRAARMARRFRGGCTLLTVLRPGEPEPDALTDIRELADTLHLKFRQLEDSDPVKAIVREVREAGATQLVVGEPAAGGLLQRYRGDIVDQLISQLEDVDIHVISRVRLRPPAPVAPPAPEPVAPAMDPSPPRYLRVYLGYAPGCGTTTAMLREAQRRRGRGTDVVVASAEIHGRPETEAAAEGLEVVPALESEAGDRRRAPDMDLAAVLARAPQVACVDDLAHHNRPGRSHEWRHQEVEALLDAGIKVISTLHVFDLEGVAAHVGEGAARLSRQRVPNSILERATEIELIDVPPAVLLERLNQERERTGDLRDNLLNLEVLTRLREAALRLVAEQTEKNLLRYMDQRGILSPWESSARVMACVTARPGMERLIRKSAEAARRAGGKLEVVTVVGNSSGSEEDRILARYAALAAEAGGQFVTLRSTRVADALVEHAQKARVTEILVSRGSGTEGQIKEAMVHRTSDIDVLILRKSAEATEPADSKAGPG